MYCLHIYVRGVWCDGAMERWYTGTCGVQCGACDRAAHPARWTNKGYATVK